MSYRPTCKYTVLQSYTKLSTYILMIDNSTSIRLIRSFNPFDYKNRAARFLKCAFRNMNHPLSLSSMLRCILLLDWSQLLNSPRQHECILIVILFMPSSCALGHGHDGACLDSLIFDNITAVPIK